MYYVQNLRCNAVRKAMGALASSKIAFNTTTAVSENNLITTGDHYTIRHVCEVTGIICSMYS